MAAMFSLVVCWIDERMVVMLLGDRRRRFLRTTPNNLFELAMLVERPFVSALALVCQRETWRRKRKLLIKVETVA